MKAAEIDPKHLAFYRADTPSGWAAYFRMTGRTRAAATPEEAARAEELARPAPTPEEPVA